MTDLFTSENLKKNKLVFAFKLFTASENKMSYKQISEYYKSLLISHGQYFKNSICPESTPTGTNSFLIIDQNNHRQIILSDTHLQYTEEKKLNNFKFNEICKSLYEFYLKSMLIKASDIKTLGKVCEFQVSHIGLYDNFIKKYNLIAAEDISKFDFRVTVSKDNKNIHFHTSCVEPDDPDEDPAELAIKFDINNADQSSGLTEKSFDEIFDFTDSFYKTGMLELLNNKLFSGSQR